MNDYQKSIVEDLIDSIKAERRKTSDQIIDAYHEKAYLEVKQTLDVIIKEKSIDEELVEAITKPVLVKHRIDNTNEDVDEKIKKLNERSRQLDVLAGKFQSYK